MSFRNNIEGGDYGVENTRNPTPEMKNFINTSGIKMIDEVTVIEREAKQNMQQISRETRFKLLGGGIHTGNDNHWNGREFTLLDDGHTYDIGGKINFSYNNRPFELSWSLDSYTNMPVRESKSTGESFIVDNFVDNKGTFERIDRATVDLKTRDTVFDNNNAKIDVTYGWGLSYTGNLGGEKIQNAWHKAGGAEYYVHAPYEKKQGIGGHIHIWFDAQKKLGEYIYAGIRANQTVKIFGQGSSNAEVLGYAGVKAKYAEIEGWMWKVLYNRDTSPTIALATSKANDTFGYVKAAIWTENLKLFYDVTTKNHGRGTIGVSFGKKF